jgi:hypothetical protein
VKEVKAVKAAEACGSASGCAMKAAKASGGCPMRAAQK